jgi:hypothetical protein
VTEKTKILFLPLYPKLFWESKEFKEERYRGMVEKVGAGCKDETDRKYTYNIK